MRREKRIGDGRMTLDEAIKHCEEVAEEKAIPLDRIKQAKEEIQKLVDMCGSDTVADLNLKSGLGLALEKIDKLIESEDKE